MKSQKDDLSSARREANRQVFTCIAIFSVASCLLIVAFGLLVWSVGPQMYTRIATQVARISPTSTPRPTPSPQPLLLRSACGQEYFARAGKEIELFYGGWGVLGFDLAQQWATALTVDLTIDGLLLEGQQQPPAPDLPLNCRPQADDIYWLYYRVVVPELDPGIHHVTVTFNALRALSDGDTTYGPGQILQETFRITVP